MKNTKTPIAKVNVKEVNAKFAKASEIAKTTKTQKGTKRVPKVQKVEVAPVVEAVITPTQQLDAMRNELLDAQAKFEGAKSPNTKKKYAKLVETILDEMKAFSDANKPEVIDVTKDAHTVIQETIGGIFEEMRTGSAPMTEKVRLADLPIGSCYKYRETGAIYKLLKVDGLMIEASESNGKTFTAKAANYKVFQVTEEAAQ